MSSTTQARPRRRTSTPWLVAPMVLFCLVQTELSPAEAGWPFKGGDDEQAQEEPRTPYEDDGEWQPYFRDHEGQTYAFEEPMEQYEDQDWLGVQFAEYKGNRSRLAVWQVEERIGPQQQETVTSYGPFSITSRSTSVPLTAIEELLTTAMFNTNRFTMVERKQIEAVLAEQDFGDSGRVTDASAARIGQALGADYILFAAINEWTPNKKSGGVLGSGKSVAEVALSIKVVDAETGQVVYADTVRGQAESRNAGLPLIAAAADNSPVNYALVSAINKVSYLLATSLESKAWEGTIVHIAGDNVVINGGEERGVAPGMRFLAVSRGVELRDPDSGELLGYHEDVIGSIQVTVVKKQTATAVILEGCEGLKAGDFVRPEEAGGP